MDAKTAVSKLKEFCDQEKVAPPHYETVSHSTDPSVFVVHVEAFNLIAKGFGHSKMKAKHAASQQLIDDLSQIDVYKSKFNFDTAPTPPATTVSKTDNFFGTILTLCLQHQLQQPNMYEISVTGVGSHHPEYTFCLELGTFKTYGIANSKKEAKRKASEEMLKLLEVLLEKEDSTSCDSNSISSSEVVPNVLPLVELPTVEEILAQYRRLRKPYLQPVVSGIRYRKNFFLKFSPAERHNAHQVLTNSYLSPIEIVDQTFKVLNLKYEIKSMDKPPNFKRFCLVDSKYDCTLIEHANILFPRIIDYLKTMLNI